MKLIKKIELGEMSFNVAVNRSIMISALKNFPILGKFLGQGGPTFEVDDSPETRLEKLIKDDKIDEFFNRQDELEAQLPQLVKHVLPLMLAEAEDNSSADEIIAYAIENEVDEEFYIGILSFLPEGFTDNKQNKKPKVKFVMK